jgi:SAM-dependent methyltransferase
VSTDLDMNTPAGIIRLGNSFCDAKALLTAVHLGLFTTLAAGPASEEQIRKSHELHGRGLHEWLELLVDLGLLERHGDQYRNAPGAGRHLVRGADGYIGGFLERSNNNLYPAWGRLADALRTGEQQSGSDFETVLGDPAILRQFVNSMDALVRVLGPQLLAAFDGWSDHKSVLDVGGCRGYMVAQLLRAHPHLSGVVFDMPQMAPFFEELSAEQTLAGKIAFQGGDFFTDPLPSADIVMIGHVLHDWDRERRGLLIGKCLRSVNPGGVLLVYDRMLDRADSRVENLVISLDMLLVTDGGSEYTVAEVREHAGAAGAADVTDHLLGDYDTLVVCRKPA